MADIKGYPLKQNLDGQEYLFGTSDPLGTPETNNFQVDDVVSLAINKHHRDYSDINAMLLDTANYEFGAILRVDDASIDSNVDFGYAYYEYLGGTDGTSWFIYDEVQDGTNGWVAGTAGSGSWAELNLNSVKLISAEQNQPIKYGSTISHSSATELAIDLYSGHRKIDLSANVTSLNLTNGIAGTQYKLLLNQDTTGGRTLTIADDWTADTFYLKYTKIRLPNGWWYICNQNHTSDATDYTNDLLNWDVWIRTENFSNIVLTINANARDLLYVEVIDENEYFIAPIYNV